MNDSSNEIEDLIQARRGGNGKYCGAWSLAPAFFMNFSLIKLVGVGHCRTHAGCMQDALQGPSHEILQGLTLTSQQVY